MYKLSAEKLELVKRLALTTLKLHYRNSALGFLWSVLNPAFTILVLTVVFSYFFPGRFEVNTPYSVFLVIGVLLWRGFTYGTTHGMRAIGDNAYIVRKVYFPRELLPASAVLTALIKTILEVGVFFIFIIILSFFFEISITPTILIFPYFLLLEFIFILGLALALSPIYVYFRDISHIWEVVIFAGFFATPIFYPMKVIPYRYERFMHINPLSDIITGSREVLIFGNIPGIKTFIYPLASCLFILLSGVIIFNCLKNRIGKVV